MKDPVSALGERVANGLIENEDWARDKLRAHAGRSFLVRSGPLATAFSDPRRRHARRAARARHDRRRRVAASPRSTCRRCSPIRIAGTRWCEHRRRDAGGHAARARDHASLVRRTRLREGVRTDRRATTRGHRARAARLPRIRGWPRSPRMSSATRATRPGSWPAATKPAPSPSTMRRSPARVEALIERIDRVDASLAARRGT